METKNKTNKMENTDVFKSYYVVWKLKLTCVEKASTLGLNRTMQYGNSIGTEKIYTLSFGLNRTMQYGNSQIWVG